jgi:hypothetical protein
LSSYDDTGGNSELQGLGVVKIKASVPGFSVPVLIGLVIVLNEIVFVNFFASAGVEFVLSSAVVTIALLLQLRFAVRRDAGAPADIVVFIFNWLFLDLAPKVQLMGMPQRLVNTSTVDVGTVATTNLVCALFMVTFTVVYVILSRHAEDAAAPAAAPQREFAAPAIGIAVLICVMVVGVAAPLAYHSIGNEESATPAKLIMGRFLLFLPSATMLILLNETVRSQRKLLFSRVCVLLLMFLLVAITENPYTEKRNALGPVYLGLILVLFQNWFASPTRRMVLLVFGMVLAFPAVAVFTQDHNAILGHFSMSQVGSQIADHYFSINYDSWANIYTSIEIVRVHELQWGKQLLGALLFFVPSALWTSKPLATGIFLGNYLIAHYSMWFTNLSAPLVGEGYLDFGYIGVVAYAAGTAYFVTFLNTLARRRDRWAAFPMATYASVFLMIVLRGSLMIATAFGVAAFLAFGLASALLSTKLGSRQPRRAGRELARRPTGVSLGHGG